ncbi:glycosyltransferase [Flavobacterium sp. Sd200]|uniref:glycosyltransferase family 4 protein n=1 Tax=Flavobacterium sp. Sd200 TaxID=2692211 RepID=UPI00136EB8AC|nr:glycosyltransferase family 1 protein [Flavobacterium sp. Sd200]MXN91925.1 glycosyltransferase [Flavobacterium sp. Sd200]
MKILADPQIFNAQVYGGISRHYTEVFSELDKNTEIEINIPVYVSKNEYLKVSRLYKEQHKRYDVLFGLFSKLGISTRKMVKKWNNKKTIKALQKKDYDVFAVTYYDAYFLEHLQGKPFVLTVYDMIHELFPQYFNDAAEIAANKLTLMKRAARIIAISHNTKNDILKIYPEIEEDKIEVIYHGNSILPQVNKSIDVPENYILFVGVRDNYKNFEFLVRSVKELFEADASLKLICAGGGSFKKNELALLEELNLTNSVMQKRFEDDSELALLYKNAKCFVFPSEYEGFGIPVLEAMACGCPIVLTKNSSFPEVAAEAGIFFELGNQADLREKISLVVYNKDVRDQYIEKGLRHVERFTWQDTAIKTYEVYRAAMG